MAKRKRDNMTNNDLQNTTKDRVTRTPLNNGVNLSDQVLR